jgi:DNA-binding NarL/FixJ family response regulator
LSATRTRRRDHLRLLNGRRNFEETSGQHEPPPSGDAATAIRVLVAGGHSLLRAGYRALLESDDQIEVVAEAADCHDVIRLAGETQPDVALLDLALAAMDDPEAITATVSHPALAGVATVLIAPPNSEERVLSALRAGAIGALANDAEPAELISSVLLVAGGKALLPARVVRRVLRELPTHFRLDGRVAERFKELTEREREIVALAATGLNNTEIAERLVISTATAKTHISRAMIKLHARHRAQLVAIAYESGLVRAVVDGNSEPHAQEVPTNGSSRVTGMPQFRSA